VYLADVFDTVHVTSQVSVKIASVLYALKILCVQNAVRVHGSPGGARRRAESERVTSLERMTIAKTRYQGTKRKLLRQNHSRHKGVG